MALTWQLLGLSFAYFTLKALSYATASGDPYASAANLGGCVLISPPARLHAVPFCCLCHCYKFWKSICWESSCNLLTSKVLQVGGPHAFPNFRVWHGLAGLSAKKHRP